MDKPPYQYTNEDIVKELENLYTQLRNMQSDFLGLGMIICGLLAGILVMGGFALYHFWHGAL